MFQSRSFPQIILHQNLHTSSNIEADFTTTCAFLCFCFVAQKAGHSISILAGKDILYFIQARARTTAQQHRDWISSSKYITLMAILLDYLLLATA